MYNITNKLKEITMEGVNLNEDSDFNYNNKKLQEYLSALTRK